MTKRKALMTRLAALSSEEFRIEMHHIFFETQFFVAWKSPAHGALRLRGFTKVKWDVYMHVALNRAVREDINCAVWYASKFRSRNCIPILAKLLADPSTDFSTIQLALSVSRFLPDRRLIEQILRLLGHPDPRTRFEAAEVLGEVGDYRHVSQLKRLLSDLAMVGVSHDGEHIEVPVSFAAQNAIKKVRAESTKAIRRRMRR